MTTLKTKMQITKSTLLFGAAIALAAMLLPSVASAAIDGIPGVTNGDAQEFDFTAREGYISIPEGGSVYMWGYSQTADALMQLPGPTMIVNQGDTVKVTLHNALPAAAGNISIVFPGHAVVAADGVPGELVREAPPGGFVTYTFAAENAGTYQYHSGTKPDLQVEMGLYGALIVRPATAGFAYEHPEANFDRETLFLLSEIDLDIHQAAELQRFGPGPIELPPGPYGMEYWLINGRAAPDTMSMAGTDVLPTQPYNCMPMMHPGERLLMRVIGAGRDMHPYHHHGNHSRVIARDGRLLVSENDEDKLAGPLLFTIPSIPGGTTDAIFEWTGKDLGWDIYSTSFDPIDPSKGHSCNGVSLNQCLADGNPSDCYVDGSPEFDPVTHEYCPDHGRAIPVELPNNNVLAFGGFWSGSPYLGGASSLPPGEGGLNPSGGFTYMWHSHTEREMVNNDVFPGGMMTMLMIVAPDVLIDEMPMP